MRVTRELDRDDRFARRDATTGGREELGGPSDSLDHEADRVGVRVGGEEVEVVGDVRGGLVAGRDQPEIPTPVRARAAIAMPPIIAPLWDTMEMPPGAG